MMIRFASFVILSILAGGGLVDAQQTLAVRTLSLRDGEMPQLYLRGVKEYHALEFSSVQPGEVMRALAANTLPLYRQETDSGGKQRWVAAQQIRIPAGAKGILILAIANGDKTLFTAIDDDFTSARHNDWLLINVSSKPITFLVGEKSKPVVIQPGASTKYRVSAPGGKGAAILAQAPIKGKPTVFYSTYWPVYSDRRSVILFADNGPKILVKRISDMLAQTKASAVDN